jgi:hypothetical protein
VSGTPTSRSSAESCRDGGDRAAQAQLAQQAQATDVEHRPSLESIVDRDGYPS